MSEQASASDPVYFSNKKVADLLCRDVLDTFVSWNQDKQRINGAGRMASWLPGVYVVVLPFHELANIYLSQLHSLLGQSESHPSPAMPLKPGQEATVKGGLLILGDDAQAQEAAFAGANKHKSVLLLTHSFSRLNRRTRREMLCSYRRNWKTPVLMGEILSVGYNSSCGCELAEGDWLNSIERCDIPDTLPKDLVPEAGNIIQRSVERVLQLRQPSEGFSLCNAATVLMPGMGEGKVWASSVARNVEAVLAGRLSWHELDKGALLSGPPGTGKTSLVKNLGQALNIPVMQCSYAKWHRGNKFDTTLAAMHETFDEAKKSAPCILFIDEIDAFGNRSNFSGANKQYETDMLIALLEEVDGCTHHEGVLVVGATNDSDNVDPALRRAGRLNHLINVTLPDAQGRAEIFAHYLRGTRSSLALDELITLGEMSEGKSGADIEQICRGVHRKEKLEGMAGNFSSICQTIFQGEHGRNVPAVHRERTATYMSGAIVCVLTGVSHGEDLLYAVLDSNRSLSGGEVKRSKLDLHEMTTREQLKYELECLLAGRAAESIFYGNNDLSNQSGGDLTTATELAWQAVSAFGMGASNYRLASTRGGIPFHVADLSEIESLLQVCFMAVMKRLKKHKETMIRVRNILYEYGYVTQQQIKALTAEPEQSSGKITFLSTERVRRTTGVTRNASF